MLAFLLAIGPIFIGMLLFDQTRGLFEGWVRATFSFAMAPLAVTRVRRRDADDPAALPGPADEATPPKTKFDMGPVITIGIIVTVFVMVMMFGLGAVAAIGRGFGFSRSSREDEPEGSAACQRLTGRWGRRRASAPNRLPRASQ